MLRDMMPRVLTVDNPTPRKAVRVCLFNDETVVLFDFELRVTGRFSGLELAAKGKGRRVEMSMGASSG